MIRSALSILALLGSLATPKLAWGQLPVAFDPCRPDVGQADFARLCDSDLQEMGGAGILISGASADTHRDLLSIFAFAGPSAITTARLQAAGQALAETEIYKDIAIQPEQNLLRVTLVEKPRISGWQFQGNTALDDGELAEILNFPIGSPFVSDLVVARSRLILAEYQTRGYFAAALTPSVRATRSFDIANGALLIFEIDEGGLTPISSLRFEGNETLAPDELAALIAADTIKTANQLTPEWIGNAQRLILEAYGETDMARTSVSVRIETLDAAGDIIRDGTPPASLAVVFAIEEQESFQIGEVRIDGAEAPDGEAEEDGESQEITPGDPFDPEDTQDAAQDLAQRLNETSEVDLGVKTELEVDEDSGAVNVTFVVYELPPAG